MTRMQTQQTEFDERWFFLVWLLLSAWLLACALLIEGEYGDGYQTIVNARYFFGDSDVYYLQRGPLAGLVLWPVEAIVGILNLNPVDVRPYHLYSGFLHSAYLLGCWFLLKRSGQAFAARFLAFIVAILSVVFFANAAYLSHDLIPGLLFLLLIFMCNRWIDEPAPDLAILMLLIGTAVTFIKQSYAIFWIALCIYAVFAFFFKWNSGSVTARKMFTLFAIAGLSGVLSWVGYGWFIGGEIPQVSLLERPIALVNAVAMQYESDGEIALLFPLDLYLRNLHNYGIGTILLLVPGLVLAFRGDDARLRMIAACWVISVVALQFVAFKEVRYLAFLAPLSAMLILPVVTLVLRSHALLLALLAIIFVDQYRGLTMAAAQLSLSPSMNVTRFVGEVDSDIKMFASDILSFVYMAESPILRDRYHGIFHLTANHLIRLNEGRVEVQKIEDPRDIGVVGIEPGDRVLYSNKNMVRRPPWGENNIPLGMEQLIVISGNAALIDLDLHEDQFLIQGHDGMFVLFIPRAESGKQMPLIASDYLPIAQVNTVYGDAVGSRLQVLGVVIDTFCRADRCTYY